MLLLLVTIVLFLICLFLYWADTHLANEGSDGLSRALAWVPLLVWLGFVIAGGAHWTILRAARDLFVFVATNL